MASNSFTPYTPEYWSKRMQIIRKKKTVYSVVANMEEKSTLSDGDTVNRPLKTSPYVTDYQKGTDVTTQDLSGTQESLTVNQFKTAPFYIDDIEQMQSSYDLNNTFADEAGKRMEEFIDADFLSEVTNATNTVDEADVGGSSGSAITVSPSNITKVFTSAQKYLNQENVDMEGRYAVISPTGHQVLMEKLDGKDSALGDSTGQNGNIGKYMGFDLYVSNNTYYTATWTPNDNPSDGDTVTINGVTFTFETGTLDTAGMVNVGGDLGASLDNLAAAINGTGTPGTDYVALSHSDRSKLVGATATNDSDTHIDLTFDGGGEVSVAASEANDPWSAQKTYWMFGQEGAVDVVVQKAADVKFKEHPDRRGQNVIPLMVYGIKTFSEGQDALVSCEIDASDF